MRVEPITEKLQEAIENGSKDDMSDLLTQPHIQFIYSYFLGPTGESGKTDKHEIWRKYARQVGNEGSLKHHSKGMSHTITTHIREFSTALQNLWQGNVYEKSLDYLLRILLRLHLAPIREKQQRMRIKAMKDERDKKQKQQEQGRQQGQYSTLNKRSWKRQVLALFNDLSDSVRNHKPVNRSANIAEKLGKLQQAKPMSKSSSGDPPILPLDERLKKIASSTSNIETTDEVAYLDGVANLDEIVDLDDVIDFFEEEDEQEHDEQEKSQSNPASGTDTQGNKSKKDCI